MLQGTDISFSELWGIGNFGMARLLTKEQVSRFSRASLEGVNEGVLYLEIRHDPNSNDLRWGADPEGRTRPMLALNTTLIPLDESHIQSIMNNLYTSRFFVKDGRGARYYMNKPMFAPFSPSFFGVPDGCYEFYNGKAWEIKWGGTRFLLPKEHLLYQSSIENVQTLFNLGIQLNGSYAPQHKEQALYPNRYVYFRDGDLYVMGAPLFSKDDPQLKLFVEKELHKEEISNTRYSYRAFVDRGAPLRMMEV